MIGELRNSNKVDFKDKSLNLLIVGGVVLVVILLGVIFGLPSLKKNIKTNINTNTGIDGGTVSESRYLGIAKSVDSWIKLQKNNDGVYSLGCECVDVKCQACKPPYYIDRIFPFILWGRYKYAEVNSDYKEVIEDIDKFHSNLRNVLQYGSWNCKLVYEAWKNNNFSNKTKDQIKDICKMSQYEFDDDIVWSEDMDNILSSDMTKIEKSQIISNEGKKIPDDINKHSSLVSEMVTRLQWGADLPKIKKDEKLTEVELAKIYFERTLINFSNKTNKTIKDIAMVGIASVDMYRLTKNKEFLDFATYVFKLTPQVNNRNSYDLVYHAWLAKELAEITKDNSYDLAKKNIMDMTIKYSFEGVSVNGAFRGAGIYYFVTENSLISGILSTIK